MKVYRLLYLVGPEALARDPSLYPRTPIFPEWVWGTETTRGQVSPGLAFQISTIKHPIGCQILFVSVLIKSWHPLNFHP